MSSASEGRGALRVALDATPLIGVRTGVGEFCLNALDGLAKHKDVEATTFAVSWRRRRAMLPHVPRGVRAVSRPMPARPLHRTWRWVSWPPVEWWTGPQDVVHGTNFVVPPARKAGRVVTVHDLTTVRFPEMCDSATRVFPALVEKALRQGAWVHTPSEFVAEEVVSLLGADPSRVRAIHHGIPLDVAEGSLGPRAEAVGDGLGGAPYILALGTVEPRKGLPNLIKAFDALAGGHPDVRLVVAGPDGWGSAAFEETLSGARARDRVIRLGYVSPIMRQELMSGAAVFAYPSIYEGFGFPPLEAMARGVPVVTTRAGALPEVVDDAAVLVDVGDPQALAGALSSLLDDESLRAERVAAGLRRVKDFSWERCADGLVALYREVASQS